MRNFELTLQNSSSCYFQQDEEKRVKSNVCYPKLMCLETNSKWFQVILEIPIVYLFLFIVVCDLFGITQKSKCPHETEKMQAIIDNIWLSTKTYAKQISLAQVI